MTTQPLKLLHRLQPYLDDGTALWVSPPIALCIDKARLLQCPDPAAEVEAAIKFLRAYARTVCPATPTHHAVHCA
jgi:hypothetical protein